MKTIAVLILLSAALATAAGFWTEPKLVGTYANWDYWWLNVRIGVDPETDTVYCAVVRYNYSQSDPEFDLYVLNSAGDTIRVMRPWHGYEYQPIVQGQDDRNIYVGQPLLGFALSNSYFHMDAGVTDDSNTVSSTNSNNDTVYLTRLGPDGSRITWREPVFAGNPWTGRTSLAIDPRGWLHCTFADDIEHLVYGFSTDKGLTWTWDTLASQRVMSHVRIAATNDTCVHIVYRTWTSGVQLRYLKLKPDRGIAVGSSIFSDGNERWEPNIALDTSGNLRVVFVDGAQNSQNLYYTVLRTDLDSNGQPVPDSELTLVPDTIILFDPVRVAGPKICIDSRDNAHILYEQGAYGNGTTKYVFHIGQNAGQAIGHRPNPSPLPILAVHPNPVLTSSDIRFSLERAGQVRLALHDATGRLVRSLLCASLSAGQHHLRLDRRNLSPGAYFVLLESAQGSSCARLTIAR
jgi:hypothetical protein